MDENPNFSQRNNAKRAAEKMIAAGTAPAVDYGIRTRDDGRFEVVWKRLGMPPTTEDVADEIATAVAAAEQTGPDDASPATAPVETEIPSTTVIPASFDDATGAYIGSDEYERQEPLIKVNKCRWCHEAISDPIQHGIGICFNELATAVDAEQENSGSVAHEQAQPDPATWPEVDWPAGTQVKLTGTIVERVDADHWRILIDGPLPRLTIVVAADDFAAAARRRSPVAKPGTERRMSKSAELDARAARGEMPDKPDVTSHANHHYQKRFNLLTEFAASGDWDAVRAYECNGINSYAKQVRQYRDRLLAAHAAQ
jgi:hypothetical protein